MLNGSNSEYIYLNSTANTTDLGTAIATVTAIMKDYPTIKSAPISFNVTILGYTVPTIPNQVYISNSQPLVILYDSFKIIPQYFDVGNTQVNAFIFKGTTIPQNINLTCDCLEDINDLEWI